LRELPPPEWLVEGLIPAKGLVCLYGAPGVGKSFVALDLALSVIQATTFLSHETNPGPVVYVAAEGSFGLGRRIDGWESAREQRIEDGLFVLPEAVQLLDVASVSRFIEEAAAVKPRLIVVDTLARCFVGGDENSAQDMGRAIASLDKIARATNAAVLPIHHTTKSELGNGPTERGSSALRGAAETMMLLERDGKGRVLRCTKQKDAEEFAKLKLSLERVTLANGGTSAVVEFHEVGLDAGPGLRPDHRLALGVLFVAPEGMQLADWRAQVGAVRGTDVPGDTFAKWRQRLEQQGLIETVAKGHVRLTDAGRALVAPTELAMAA
jgi:KaiC/GvpD/RAD55 family RecA-like ATPase